MGERKSRSTAASSASSSNRADFQCDSSGAVHYETIGVIQGMQHLPATFTPGPRLGEGLDAAP